MIFDAARSGAPEYFEPMFQAWESEESGLYPTVKEALDRTRERSRF
jgi:hypothetical protein